VPFLTGGKGTCLGMEGESGEISEDSSRETSRDTSGEDSEVSEDSGETSGNSAGESKIFLVGVATFAIDGISGGGKTVSQLVTGVATVPTDGVSKNVSEPSINGKDRLE